MERRGKERKPFIASLKWGAGVLLVSVGLAWASAAAAHSAEPDRFPELHRRLDEALAREELREENVALMLFSTRKKRFLYRLREEEPMIAASNVKLATTYAALRQLSPNFEWRTRFYRVETHDGSGDFPRQGLLVVGGGDPSLTSRHLDEIALQLKTRGVHWLDGALFLDDSEIPTEAGTTPLNGASGSQAWAAAPNAFILDNNVAEFFVIADPIGSGIEVVSRGAPDDFQLVSHLVFSENGGPLIRVNQAWPNGKGRFVFRGHVPLAPKVFFVSTAISDPAAYFSHRLRASLHRRGIGGKLPLRPLPSAGLATRHIHTHRSEPLRELLTTLNKESNNLAAEMVVRALGRSRRPAEHTVEAGLAVLQGAIFRDFPKFREQVRLVDGSGLSRENRLSASFIVHLLNRVLSHGEFRSDFVRSLSVGGWDGTLEFREYPGRIKGRIRAKSGTLAGVQNLSGYLYTLTDQVVFSFLINGDPRPFQELQAAQDRVLTEIFDQLLAEEAPSPPPEKSPIPPETTAAPQPAAQETQAAARVLVPPPPSRKPAQDVGKQ